MKRKRVVTSLIERGEKILLLRRSSRVGTYQGYWSGVSGYLEAAPLAQAIREIQEELSLSSEAVELKAWAGPVDVTDRNDRWRIYPFLFELGRSKRVRLDWENRAYRWVRPSTISEFKTVPGLDRVYGALVKAPRFSQRVHRQILGSLRDHQSGSSTLVLRAIEIVGSASREIWSDFPQETIRRMKHLTHALALIHPPMVAVANTLSDLTRSLQRDRKKIASRTAFERTLRRFQRSFVEGRRRALQSMARRARSLWPREGPLLVYSNSSTLVEVLKHAPRLPVVVPECRPMYEGRLLARSLQKIGFPVTVITDAMIGSMLPKAQAVAVGADAIVGDRYFVNKVGTSLLALGARAHRIPFYLFSEECKKVAPSRAELLEELSYPPEEVWPKAPSYIRVENRYFEKIPLRLVTSVITPVC